MRYHGTIVSWDNELGFGFVREEQSTAEIFAHAGDFVNENPPPSKGETVSFEIVCNSRGTEEAKHIEYTNRNRVPEPEQFDFTDEAPKKISRWVGLMIAAIIGVPALSAAAYYAMDYWQTYRAAYRSNEIVVDRVAAEMMAEREAWKRALNAPAGRSAEKAEQSGAASEASEEQGSVKLKLLGNVRENFRCDGRQHCSQMRSFEEAQFFLNNCPNVKMDGDKDGIPCEDHF
ncbi:MULTISPECIES: excalibur calcium-binding domain-containing protein [unclassified Neisseria]|uniref:excalibur calcium-binding domain-containing protein n=1 Tax=unclassified Neisseria TaxID=2623750 RepID=UPI002666DF6E|nr:MULTISPECIES: excalibur calcium-binding domain-containing protein [unclassified Neisseria]MDO1510150.1 excalibur calcium-binding domain-containing protein [Neisseria sp. MVDL19-042950]MDO1516726.1 excalibur calcium-binding domain-containing protein [Neisseria sp. MVDL18-041461]MDO1563873.1 excalibur calcium-binding domain-containing protein [Neisseria sp. MVDL20-010259]